MHLSFLSGLPLFERVNVTAIIVITTLIILPMLLDIDLICTIYSHHFYLCGNISFSALHRLCGSDSSGLSLDWRHHFGQGSGASQAMYHIARPAR